jgi:hypothetical protein
VSLLASKKGSVLRVFSSTIETAKTGPNSSTAASWLVAKDG